MVISQRLRKRNCVTFDKSAQNENLTLFPHFNAWQRTTEQMEETNPNI